MYTFSQLRESVILIDSDDKSTPFIIDKGRIVGNVFGFDTPGFRIKNYDEVLLHIGNQRLIPDEHLGKLKIICNAGYSDSADCTIFLAYKGFVLTHEEYSREIEKGAFSSAKSWQKLRDSLSLQRLLSPKSPANEETYETMENISSLFK